MGIIRLPKSDNESSSYDRDVITFDDLLDYQTSIRASALVFHDKSSRQLSQLIRRIAPSDASVLIRGETGTGKELVAREIHRFSKRSDKPFIALNCGAIPETLIDSELFGHEKGAFTGAASRKEGWFEAAHQGTLFLDEIGDLPLSGQVKLLRVLQEHQVTRVGSREPIPNDVRIIAATNVELRRAVDNGRFRMDLFYRLNVAPIELLPLSKRPDDILPLVGHFVGRYGKQLGIPRCNLSEACRKKLLDYSWPGNIRELENVIHRAMLVMNGNTIEAADLNLPDLPTSGVVTESGPTLVDDRSVDVERTKDTTSNMHSYSENTNEVMSSDLLSQFIKNELDNNGKLDLDQIEHKVVSLAYKHCHLNQVKTADLLGVTRNVIRHKLKRYGLIR